VVREMAMIQSESPAGVSPLSLDAVKLAIEEEDIIANGELDRLIRDNAISAEMATSLMNDSAYAYDVADNLIQMGRVLFVAPGHELQDVESELILNDEEMSELLEEEQKTSSD
jgi:phosphate:Na+ symporter